MSNVVPFKRPQPRLVHASCIVRKVVNGEIVECVDVDALSPTERANFFMQQEGGAPQKGRDAPA
jgi:hypothetical protein